MARIPQSEVIIRPVTPESVAADLGAGRLALPPGYTDGMGEQIRAGDISFHVAQAAGGLVVGRVGVNWLGPGRVEKLKENLSGVPNVAFMQVLTEYRGRGIGGRLMDAVIGEADTRGHGRLFLAVATDASAAPARRLYERKGFRTWEHGLIVAPDHILDDVIGTTTRLPEREAMVMIRDMRSS